MDGISLGIDFGTSSTLVSYMEEGAAYPRILRLGREGDSIPTSAYLLPEGDLLFGEAADEMEEECPERYVHGFKKDIAERTAAIHLPEYQMACTAKELATAFFRHILGCCRQGACMGGSISRTVLTCPVDFTPAQRQALLEAAQKAGLPQVELVEEPVAAAHAFSRLCPGQSCLDNALLVDWGGGAVRFNLVTRQGDSFSAHPECRSADDRIGGEALDARLWKYIRLQIMMQNGPDLQKEGPEVRRRMLRAVRHAKEQLAYMPERTLRFSGAHGPYPPVKLTYKELASGLYNEIAQSIDAAQQVVDAMQRCNVAASVMLGVGGMGKSPVFVEKLQKVFSLPFYPWRDGREAAAFGAALLAAAPAKAAAQAGRMKPAPAAAPAEPGARTRSAVPSSTCGGAPVPSLLEAVQRGDWAAVEPLLQRGADANECNAYGWTPLLKAAGSRNPKAVESLLAYGADANARNARGWTPLMLAAAQGDAPTMSALIRYGADVNAQDKDGETALTRAAAAMDKETMDLLISNGADVAGLNGEVLIIAAQEGRAEIVEFLLQRGVDANSTDASRRTALMAAAGSGRKGCPAVVRCLLAHGADPAAVDGKGMTALHYARSAGNREAEALLRAAAPQTGGKPQAAPRPQSNVPDAALFNAVARWNAAEVERLLALGANPSAKNETGNTPLMQAAYIGATGIAGSLIAAGAEVDAQNSQGLTALMYAAYAGNKDMVRYLVQEHLADIGTKDAHGNTALSYARSYGHRGIADFLSGCGAR